MMRASHATREPIEWDDGVASERTMLSWQRTALSTIVIAVLVLRAGLARGPLGVALPLGALLILVAAAEWMLSRRVYVEHNRPQSAGAVLHDHWMVVLVVVTLSAAGGSMILGMRA